MDAVVETCNGNQEKKKKLTKGNGRRGEAGRPGSEIYRPERDRPPGTGTARGNGMDGKDGKGVLPVAMAGPKSKRSD